MDNNDVKKLINKIRKDKITRKKKLEKIQKKLQMQVENQRKLNEENSFKILRESAEKKDKKHKEALQRVIHYSFVSDFSLDYLF